ncbi:hypothetical protein [Burkholderia cenocepacia]|uniref:hypothetical protein n=1 Tax=Burkholderia cenocepacia TaxID=95486 RepID=UPI0028639362|nr:hypothetical protein [Burkholderia cenocepacia]MDR8068275.1 hypothetical protein [Burkholderia cenocepacia]
MSNRNSTECMALSRELEECAARELYAAGDALMRVQTLLGVMRSVVTSGEETFNMLNLVDSAIEIASMYAERATNESLATIHEVAARG